MTDRSSHHVVTVIGGTFSGNKGAAGMLEAAIGNLRSRLTDPVVFNVVSIYPRADRKKKLPEDVVLIGATPPVFVLVLPIIAFLYGCLKRLHLPKSFLLRFKPLNAIVKTELVLDVSGISFSDDRGFILLYNLACSIPPMLVGTPQVKLSQAMGPFTNSLNRAAAKAVLPRITKVFARGTKTAQFLTETGIVNFEQADDLAFILGDALGIDLKDYPNLSFLDSPEKRIIGIVPSQVVENYLNTRNCSLVGILHEFIERTLADEGTHVVILAHSLLSPDTRSKNNDYHIVKDLSALFKGNGRVSVVLEDLSAIELRAVIRKCSLLVASRFHGMISALCTCTPVLVIAWAHKYAEVMNGFGLGRYVLDFAELTSDGLFNLSEEILANRAAVRAAIAFRLPFAIQSSMKNIDYAVAYLENPHPRNRYSRTVKKLYERFYGDAWKKAWTGYARDSKTRERAASGGAVSSLLIHLLESGEIDGAVVARTEMREGQLRFRTFIANSAESVLSSGTSIYSDFPHLSDVLKLLESRSGKYAVVALPCQLSALDAHLLKNPETAKRLVLKIGLWCGHATRQSLMNDFLRIKGIDLSEVESLCYRTGRWRGVTEILLKSGEVKKIPFSSGYGLYQNLYVDCCERCLSCTDHFAGCSDVSFGDAWLPELKTARIKYSMALAHTDKGVEVIERASGTDGKGPLHMAECDVMLPVRAQKRAVVWHTHNAAARARIASPFGYRLSAPIGVRPRLRDYPAALLVLLFAACSRSRFRPVIFRVPRPVLRFIMLVQKLFLNS